MTQRIVEDEYARKFHPFPGYEEFYEINLLGEVLTKPRWVNSPICGGKRLRPARMIKVRLVNGYPTFNAVSADGTQKIVSIHRALAILFIPNPAGKPCINHKDGDKANFSLTNLEWCTHQENMRHAFDTGLAKAPDNGPGEASPAAKLTDEKVRSIKASLSAGATHRSLAAEYGVSRGNIGHIASGKTWGHIK